MGGGEEYTGGPHRIQDDLLNNEEFIHQESGSPTEGRSMPFSPVNISPSEARTIDNQTEGQPHLLQANNFSEDKYRQNVHDTVEKVQKGSVREIMSIYIQDNNELNNLRQEQDLQLQKQQTGASQINSRKR